MWSAASARYSDVGAALSCTTRTHARCPNAAASSNMIFRQCGLGAARGSSASLFIRIKKEKSARKLQRPLQRFSGPSMALADEQIAHSQSQKVGQLIPCCFLSIDMSPDAGNAQSLSAYPPFLHLLPTDCSKLLHRMSLLCNTLLRPDPSRAVTSAQSRLQCSLLNDLISICHWSGVV
jgi:hypothetical protein